MIDIQLSTNVILEECTLSDIKSESLTNFFMQSRYNTEIKIISTTLIDMNFPFLTSTNTLVHIFNSDFESKDFRESLSQI